MSQRISGLASRRGQISGLPLMKFTLTFEGELPSTGNRSRKKQIKWNLRKAFHPQLLELSLSHPVLRSALRQTFVPIGAEFMTLERHHLDPLDGLTFAERTEAHKDLCAPIECAGRQFVPIVRETLALICGLNITFLRKEAPGSLILQGGDLDNRIKTLFDALRMPSDQEVVDDPTAEYPMFCLLESDALITQCNIKTDRLLTHANASPHSVHLLIEVDVRVVQARSYNLAFLSD